MDETRRTFCATACRAASVAAAGTAFGAVFDACSGSPGSGVNAQNLPVVSGSFANAAITVSVAGASPLAAVGALAIVTSSGGNVLWGAHVRHDVQRAQFRLPPRGLHRVWIQRPDVCVSLPRLRIRHKRAGGERPGRRRPVAVADGL